VLIHRLHWRIADFTALTGGYWLTVLPYRFVPLRNAFYVETCIYSVTYKAVSLPKGASSSSSFIYLASMTISAYAGTCKSIVLHFTTSRGSPAMRPPRRIRQVDGNFCYRNITHARASDYHSCFKRFTLSYTLSSGYKSLPRSISITPVFVGDLPLPVIRVVYLNQVLLTK